jgi:hypothetical protein
MILLRNEVRYLKCSRTQDVELVEDEGRRAPMERTTCEVPYLTNGLTLLREPFCS